jgi:predicted small lipoprotein YifL
MKKRFKLILFVFLITAVVSGGCGKKAPPIPPDEIANIDRFF